MKNPFFLLSAWVYGKFKPALGKKNDPKVYKALLQLHPMENIEKL